MNQQEKEVAAATHMWRLSRFSVTSIPSLLSSAVKGKVSRVFQVAFIFSLHVSAAHRFVHSFIRLLREPFQFRSWLFVYGPRVLFHFQTSNPNSYPTQPPPRLELLGHLSNFQSHIWYCHARLFCSLRNRKGFSVEISGRCGGGILAPCALRLACWLR